MQDVSLEDKLWREPSQWGARQPQRLRQPDSAVKTSQTAPQRACWDMPGTGAGLGLQDHLDPMELTFYGRNEH
jgi:hypothetical protein